MPLKDQNITKSVVVFHVSRLYIQTRQGTAFPQPFCSALPTPSFKTTEAKVKPVVHKQQIGHNCAGTPSNAPKEVVHASVITCLWSQCSSLHAAQPHRVQSYSLSSSHTATTTTLPKGVMGLVIWQSTDDLLLDTNCASPNCLQGTAQKKATSVSLHPTPDGSSKSYIPNNRDTSVLD